MNFPIRQAIRLQQNTQSAIKRHGTAFRTALGTMHEPSHSYLEKLALSPRLLLRAAKKANELGRVKGPYRPGTRVVFSKAKVYGLLHKASPKGFSSHREYYKKILANQEEAFIRGAITRSDK